MNPNDAVRDAILRHLYNVHSHAKSPKSAGEGVRDVQKALRDAGGFKQQEVASNLDYLIQKGWVREEIVERSFTTPRGTTQSSEKRTYKISDTGIDKLEAASTYQRPDSGSHINITNVHGVTVVGEGNVVNTSFTDLSRVLTELRIALISDPQLDDPQKLDVAADIDALQSQLQKPEPSKSVISTLWRGIQATATTGSAVELTQSRQPSWPPSQLTRVNPRGISRGRLEAALERAGEGLAHRALLEALDELGEEALDDQARGDARAERPRERR